MKKKITIKERDNASAHKWAWLQKYPLWEANRKIFLYPENWLEQELRDDKSEFFHELENELLRNDMTSEACADACALYLIGIKSHEPNEFSAIVTEIMASRHPHPHIPATKEDIGKKLREGIRRFIKKTKNP